GDAFVHASALEAAGQKDLQDGAQLECEIEQGPRGPMVSVIHSVTGSSPEAASASSSDAPTIDGTVKFFDPDKGYGFIVPDGDGQDIFVSGRVVAQSGLTGNTLRNRFGAVPGLPCRRPTIRRRCGAAASS
ncbi:MAG: cold shock domain-containing protein, partial [Alphaproteobacteria bacterium]